MHPLAPMAELMKWASRNTSYNLEFIPEDRLAWKPAPTAKSALEIVAHVVRAIRGMRPVLEGGGEWSPGDVPVPSGLRAAQDVLESAAAEYAEALQRVDPAQLSRTVSIAGAFSFPLARAASLPVIDMIHHHGQIAYIQTLLGDEEFHFFEEGKS